MSGLNSREQKFFDNVVMGVNPYQAAMKAGFSESFAKARSYTLLERPHIKNAFEKFKEKSEKRIENCFDRQIHKLDLMIEAYIPNDIEELRIADPIQVGLGLNALKEINKMRGYYAPTKNLNINATIEGEEAKKIQNNVKLLEQYRKDY